MQLDTYIRKMFYVLESGLKGRKLLFSSTVNTYSTFDLSYISICINLQVTQQVDRKLH